MKRVSDIHPSNDMSDMLNQMRESGGFTAKKLGVAADIIERMFREDCTNFLSFPACIVATGTRGVIRDLVKEKRVDALITTCGTMDHDLARLWKGYYHGTFLADDASLYKKGVNRLGNVFVPNESYGIVLEKKLQPIFKRLHKKQSEWSTSDLVHAVGKEIAKEKNAKDSITYWAAKNKIPVFLPGPLDGAFGCQLWMHWQEHRDFRLNLFKDEQRLAEMVFDAKKSGAILVGGGISKHHVIWWNQFRGGLDYCVGLTTAAEWDGSLSGARVREAVSWGKVKEKAKYVTVEGDATVTLPLLVGAVKARLR